jgi:hypothetical protein
MECGGQSTQRPANTPDPRWAEGFCGMIFFLRKAGCGTQL